jgi:hypothetical protein
MDFRLMNPGLVLEPIPKKTNPQIDSHGEANAFA